MNTLGSSMKEIGPGSRRDTLDDHFGDMNWKKVCGLGLSSIMFSWIEFDRHLDRHILTVQNQSSCAQVKPTLTRVPRVNSSSSRVICEIERRS
jgi:hypothetical protein